MFRTRAAWRALSAARPDRDAEAAERSLGQGRMPALGGRVCGHGRCYASVAVSSGRSTRGRRRRCAPLDRLCFTRGTPFPFLALVPAPRCAKRPAAVALPGTAAPLRRCAAAPRCRGSAPKRGSTQVAPCGVCGMDWRPRLLLLTHAASRTPRPFFGPSLALLCLGLGGGLRLTAPGGITLDASDITFTTSEGTVTVADLIRVVVRLAPKLQHRSWGALPHHRTAAHDCAVVPPHHRTTAHTAHTAHTATPPRRTARPPRAAARARRKNPRQLPTLVPCPVASYLTTPCRWPCPHGRAECVLTFARALRFRFQAMFKATTAGISDASGPSDDDGANPPDAVITDSVLAATVNGGWRQGFRGPTPLHPQASTA